MTKIRSEWKKNNRNGEDQNPDMALKANVFKSHNKSKISTNSDELRCNTSGIQLVLLLMKLSHENTKLQQKQAEAETSKIVLWNYSVEGTIFIRRQLEEL